MMKNKWRMPHPSYDVPFLLTMAVVFPFMEMRYLWVESDNCHKQVRTSVYKAC